MVIEEEYGEIEEEYKRCVALAGGVSMPEFREKRKKCLDKTFGLEEARARLKEVQKIEDKKDRAKILYDLLHHITELQDIINLSIPELNSSMLVSKSLANDANALLLAISRSRGNLRKELLYETYLSSKMRQVNNSYNAMVHELNRTLDDPKDLKPKIQFEWFDDREGHINPMHEESKTFVFKDQVY